MQTSEQMGRIPALDGIRGLAISLVLWWHIFGWLRENLPNHPFLGEIAHLGRFAWSGVDLFFVLSGFLIGGILLDAVASPSYFSTFYLRRAYRILPLYAAILTLTLVIDLCFDRDHLEQFFYYPLFLQNFQMALTGSFGLVHLGMTWSLAVEEQFYLTMPLVIHVVSRRSLTVILVVVILVVPLLRAFLYFFYPDNWVAGYVLTPCRADALSTGVLIALVLREPRILSVIRRYCRAVYTLLAVFSLIGLRVLVGQFQPYETKAFGLEYSFLAVLFGLLLLSTLINKRLSTIFSFGPLRFMGSIAYGVYLLHGLLDFWLRKMWFHFRPTSGAKSEIFVAAFGAALSVVIATASWRYFEKPLVRRGHRYKYEEELAAVA